MEAIIATKQSIVRLRITSRAKSILEQAAKENRESLSEFVRRTTLAQAIDTIVNGRDVEGAGHTKMKTD